MNDRQLRYFSKVVEVGNMTRAAAMLNVAQPALGLQIRQLEEEFGVSLLDRHSRGVEATPEGTLLYNHAIEILARFEQAEKELRAAAENAVEVIALGITHSIMRLVGQDLLQAARQNLDGVRLSLTEEPSLTLLRELEAGHVDLILTYTPTTSSGLVQVPLQEEELLFARRRRDGDTSGEVITLSALLEHSLVLAGERDPIRRMVDEAASAAGTPADIHYEVQSLMATRQTVLNGDAASILPYGVVADEVSQGLVSVFQIEGAPFRRTLYMTRSIRSSCFRNEERIMRLLRCVIRQLEVELGDLARKLP